MRRQRYLLWRALRPFLRTLLAGPGGIALINRGYRVMTLRQKRRFLAVFGTEDVRREGQWKGTFCGKRLALPLRPDLPESWALALSLEGREADIHGFYARLLRSPRRPRVFFDVGAYYGLHSLKLLTHGIRTISFEPNPSCHPYLLESCRLNGLIGEIHPAAIADRPGWTKLFIPRDAPYRATVVREVAKRFADQAHVRSLDVPQTTLDAFVAESGVAPDLIKIDTEGSELSILTGSTQLLRTRRPVLVFESWRGSSDRLEMFALLNGHGYRLRPLRPPWHSEAAPLTSEEFLRSDYTNYAASSW